MANATFVHLYFAEFSNPWALAHTTLNLYIDTQIHTLSKDSCCIGLAANSADLNVLKNNKWSKN